MRAQINNRNVIRRLFLLLILLISLGSYMEGSLGRVDDRINDTRIEIGAEFADNNSDDDPNHKSQIINGTEMIEDDDEGTTTTDDDDDDEGTTTTDDDDEGSETTEEDENKDDDDDDVDDDWESKTKRRLKFEQSENEFKIESELEAGENKDNFRVRFKIEDEPSIRFEYESESGSLETELELEVEFLSLIEFTDLNGNGYLDAGDTELSTMDLSKAKYDDFQYSISNTTDGETLYEVWTQTTDGVFLVRMYVVSGFGVIDGSTITPTEIKIDIEIHDYPYVNSGSLALRLELKTEVETEVEKKDESPDEEEGIATAEEALAFASSSYLGFFSWTSNASVDGIEKPVISSPYGAAETTSEAKDDETESETELKQKGEILLTYFYGNHIVHDPKLGVAAKTAYNYIGQILESTTLSFFFFEINAKPGFLGLTMISTLILGAMVFFHRRQSHPRDQER
ncbi:MAG: hypothetical protein ACE5OZ_12665 [Candidatus Heimdallarchaeota archaeon]